MSVLHSRRWGGEECHYGVIPVCLPLLLLLLWGGRCIRVGGEVVVEEVPVGLLVRDRCITRWVLDECGEAGAEVRAFTMPAISETELGELQNFRKLSRFASLILCL